MYRRQPSAPRTSVIASSSSLPTPCASPYVGSNQTGTVGAAVRPSLTTSARLGLLATPTTSDLFGAGPRNQGGGCKRLREDVKLLPTPTTNPQAPNLNSNQKHGPPSLLEAAKLLPTPTSMMATAGNERRSGDRSGELLLPGVAKLLPTPTSTDVRNSGTAFNRAEETSRHSGVTLTDAVVRLPTPTAADARRSGDPNTREGGPSLTAALLPTPAARDTRSGLASEATMNRNARPLNEVLLAGKPTQRLNPEFVEAMMGLPIGWTSIRGSLALPRPSSASPATATSSTTTGPTESTLWATPSSPRPLPPPGPSSGPASSTTRTETLRPFFSYFGGKWTLAPKYPAPEHDVIIEPFAGSAGYATRYPDREVILVERVPEIAAMWKWLIGVSADEVMALPLDISNQAVLEKFSSEAQSFVSFWCARGRVRPRQILKGPTSWMKSGRWPTSFWGEYIRERVARQVTRIRHWRVIEGDYTAAPDVESTWFIDPPYDGSRHYLARVSDYPELGRWCQARRGLVMVCEQEGATWLPFEPFRTAKSIARRSYNEVLWTQRAVASGIQEAS